ncbi:hypothetical protein LC605_32640 [Nostoc sp. CHAB 5836]|uniref:hypothetical protein n=1 Tax=Nostoc sp. CHAB 5836 TaxID=2780404 RepID=UPI001E4BD962|nr:hypothetical protein [Nostoc sp. CHAB 5836]MCC5619692.1 hypothetical protein [Nostoc sp. CHAB 5836]
MAPARDKWSKMVKIEMKSSDKTNLMIIRKTRHKPANGDLFAGNILGKRWILGRVIESNFTRVGSDRCVLLYIYSRKFDNPFDVSFPIEPLLILPPILMTSNMMWTMGYFFYIQNKKITNDEIIGRHIFKSMSINKYVNECGQKMEEPGAGELVGEDAFYGWASLDDEISRALGVPVHASRA